MSTTTKNSCTMREIERYDGWMDGGRIFDVRAAEQEAAAAVGSTMRHALLCAALTWYMSIVVEVVKPLGFLLGLGKALQKSA